MRVIGITGANRCGKDTMASLVSAKYGYIHDKISGPLKQVVSFLFPESAQVMETDAKDTKRVFHDKTTRDLLKFIGTDVFQHALSEFEPNARRSFWIEHLVERHKGVTPLLIVSDLRFPHEVEFLRTSSAVTKLTVILVEREEEGGGSHEADTSYKDLTPDLVFRNVGSKQDMEEWINKKSNIW